MAGNVDLLIVDDNPFILQLLQKGLSGIGRLRLASGGAQALQMALGQPPDMVISDLRMPGVDGAQLFTELRRNPATSRAALILMAGREMLSQSHPMVVEAVEEFVPKPFFLQEMARRVKRIADRIVLEKLTHLSTVPGVVRGTLDQLSVADLLQSMDIGAKSCSLVLANQLGQRAVLYFDAGRLNHASFGPLSGDAAVYQALTFTQGSWAMDFRASSPLQSTSMSTQGLLLEWLRRVDEAKRAAESDEL